MFDFVLMMKTLAILFIGVISPGPDFFMILKNSLSSGRKAGIVSAFGIASGCLISFSLLMGGLNFLFTYPLIKMILSILCGAYLIYLGVSSLRSESHAEKMNYRSKKANAMMTYYKNGFFTNILNPKLYTVSGAILAYTQQQHPSTATSVGILIGNAIMVFAWFAFVATVLSHSRIQKIYFKREKLINYILGFVLIIVGGREYCSARK